jgi:hypothetical protein
MKRHLFFLKSYSPVWRKYQLILVPYSAAYNVHKRLISSPFVPQKSQEKASLDL